MKSISDSSFVNMLADSLSRSDIIEIMLKNTIVNALITSRVEKSMSQKQFAEFMGVSQAMVSKWESGDYNFTVSSIAKICEKLGLIPELELISEVDYRTIMEKNNNTWDNLISSKTDSSKQFSIAA